MIGVALALVVIGVVFLFIVPWVGIAAGIVGVVLLVLFLAGFGKRAAEGRPWAGLAGPGLSRRAALLAPIPGPQSPR